ncbi:hypothetical protein ACWF94_20360 [Streptomyces sp. NPDC055078]
MSTTETSLLCTGYAEDFTATVSTHSGERRKVTIEGTLKCPLPGYQLRLEAGNPGINPDPAELVVQIAEQPPTGTTTDVVTDTEVKGEFPIGPPVQRVVIRNLNITLALKD